MKFETVQIHFLRDVLVCCHPEILLPRQRDVIFRTSCTLTRLVAHETLACFFTKLVQSTQKTTWTHLRTIPERIVELQELPGFWQQEPGD